MVIIASSMLGVVINNKVSKYLETNDNYMSQDLAIYCGKLITKVSCLAFHAFNL
jgi:hypothetical protein